MAIEVVYVISVFNAISCLLLLIYQIPRHSDFTAQYQWISTGEYFLESMKLVAYTGGAFIYVILPCYRQCFYTIRKNFNIKFIIFSILLIAMVFIDGTSRQLYHYVAFAFFNVGCSLYVCNSVIVPEEGEVATPMAALPVLNGRVRRASSTRRAEV